MKSIAHLFGGIVLGLVAAYAAFFMLWVLLVSVCMSEMDATGGDWQVCGDNAMTDAVQVLYSPFFR